MRTSVLCTFVCGLNLSAAPVFAQLPQESDRAVVNRQTLEQAAFSEAVASRLRVPPGFRVNVFASGLKHPRMMDVASDGTVYVTRRDEGDVLALRDSDGDGRADEQRVFASNLTGVHGIALHAGSIYLASSSTVWRAALSGGAPAPIITGLPDGGQHPNRMVRIGPDGAMYVSVGSSCNDCAEENQLERATMIRYSIDGADRTVIANGLRNTIGYDWHPSSQVLWGMDHGTDFRGDQTPPEELNRIERGSNYGWPICFADRRVDTMTNAPPERMALEPGQATPSGQPMTREAYCARTEPAVMLTAAHSAPMAMRFYGSDQFPVRYRGDAFVAMHGSWNRSEPAGYKVLQVRFDRSAAPRDFEDFVTGFADRDSLVVYGRPVGVAVSTDGSLLVSDDLNGAIYRISFSGRR